MGGGLICLLETDKPELQHFSQNAIIVRSRRIWANATFAVEAKRFFLHCSIHWQDLGAIAGRFEIEFDREYRQVHLNSDLVIAGMNLTHHADEVQRFLKYSLDYQRKLIYFGLMCFCALMSIFCLVVVCIMMRCNPFSFPDQLKLRVRSGSLYLNQAHV
jgi:hypothetical protein